MYGVATIAVHSYQLTLAFMPSSGVDVEIVIHPKPWAFLDNSLQIGFLGEVLEVLPCHVIGKTDPSMFQGNNCLWHLQVFKSLTHIESVDSICRDSADMQYNYANTNFSKSPKQLTHKPLYHPIVHFRVFS